MVMSKAGRNQRNYSLEISEESGLGVLGHTEERSRPIEDIHFGMLQPRIPEVAQI